jgi:nicotinamide phosphoribosyltransferase
LHTFGGIVNEKGFKVLDSHIGLIYGDAISLAKQKIILTRLIEKGFAPSNLVLGIGSYTYEYVTRDTFGFAMKATWGVVGNEEKVIYKDPITDRGFKKSAHGLLMVYRDENGDIKLKDNCTKEEEASGLLEVIFEDGVLIKRTSLQEIRNKVDSYFE